MKDFKTNIQLKNINTNDIQLLMFLHRLVFIETYTDILPEAYLKGMSIKTMSAYWKNVLHQKDTFCKFIVANGIVVGFLTIGKARQSNDSYCAYELYNLYLLKEFQHQGLGRFVIKEVSQRYESLLIVVVEANLGGNKFYQNIGASLVKTQQRKYASQDIRENVYVWTKK